MLHKQNTVCIVTQILTLNYSVHCCNVFRSARTSWNVEENWNWEISEFWREPDIRVKTNLDLNARTWIQLSGTRIFCPNWRPFLPIWTCFLYLSFFVADHVSMFPLNRVKKKFCWKRFCAELWISGRTERRYKTFLLLSRGCRLGLSILWLHHSFILIHFWGRFEASAHYTILKVEKSYNIENI